jgi:ubiquinone/menaquinone biosynthesis C-methylase UbiE
MKKVAGILFKIILFFLVYQVFLRLLRRVYDFPAPAFIGRFLDSNFRRKMQPPESIIKRSGIKPGMKVLEVGCGSGAFTGAIARAVGNEGEVHALDIQPGMLEQLRRKLARPENEDVRNIHLHQNSAYELPFPDGTFDVVYYVTVLQEIPDPVRALREASRVLKSTGIIAVSEWLTEPDYVFASTTLQLGQKARLKHDRTFGNLWQYTVRMHKGI